MNITTKSYDSLLPFLVVEAITSQSSSFQSMSVQIMDKGWAWLVTGRRLLIWNFKESKSQAVSTRLRRKLSPSFELQLSQTDLRHKAELIKVFFLPQNPNTSMRLITVPAALCVSPEGSIRFWSSIANERFTETSIADLQGQEFCSLQAITPTEYLIGTTTGSVHLLKIDAGAMDQRGILTCSPLTTNSGLLSGISRRMTNLFFGPVTADTKTEFRRPLFATNSTDRSFFVLSSTFKLRQWCKTNDGSNSQIQFVRDFDLHKKIQSKICILLSNNQPEHVQFWPVDMIPTRSKELLILVCTLDNTRNDIVNYVTIVFNPYQAGDRLTKTTLLRSHSWQYRNGSEEQLFALRFAERYAESPICFIHDRRILFLAKIDHDILDAIDYANQDDGILGVGCADNQVMLFTQRDGLICCSTVKRQEDNDKQDDNNATRIDSSLNSSRPFVSETIHEESQMTTTLDATETSEHNDSQSEQAKDNSMASAKSSSDKTSRQHKNGQPMRDMSNAEGDFTSSKEFEWVQQIDNRQYRLASETLAKLVVESELLQDRKETLEALSKLARLAE